MLRLFLGAAIQKILSQRLEISLLSLVSSVGSVNTAGPWIANAGPIKTKHGHTEWISSFEMTVYGYHSFSLTITSDVSRHI